MELEKRRAKDVVRAKIERESAEQAAQAAKFAAQTEADGKRYAEQAAAEAHFTRQAKETDAEVYAQRQHAEAQRDAAVLEAEASLAAKRAEAEGLSAMAKAYGDMVTALGGPEMFLRYQMLKDGTYERLAHENANAIRGLQPKISVWNGIGNDGQGSGGAGAAGGLINNIYGNLPPLLDTIHEQTGMTVPSWLMGMPQEQGQHQQQQGASNAQGSGKEVAKRNGMVNGEHR